MVTTSIHIKPHLAQYIIGKYGCGDGKPVRFPDNLDLYHTIWDLMDKRPDNNPVDGGNLAIVLPKREAGKNPHTYNYISDRSRGIIERKIEIAMRAELHELLDEQKHRHGVQYIDTVHAFKLKYCITGISDDGLLKEHYRWREKIRKKKEKRKYTVPKN